MTSKLVFYCALILALSVSISAKHHNDSKTDHDWINSPGLRKNAKNTSGITINITTPAHFQFDEISFYEEHLLPAESLSEIHLDNYNKNGMGMGFGLVQVHAYIHNITLAYNSTIVKHYHQNGTNLGLVVTPYVKGLFVFNMNPKIDVWVSIAFIIYNKFVPVPGGCNLEFPMRIYPMLNMQVTDSFIEVDTPPALDVTNTGFYEGFTCGKDNLTYESFYKRLTPNDFSRPSYFEGLRKMMSGTFAKKYNSSKNKVQQAGGVKKLYAKEPGTGIIFATVVTGAGGHSMYVPSMTYSCAPEDWDGKCFNADTYTSILSTLIIVLGVFQTVSGILIGVFQCCGCSPVVAAPSVPGKINGVHVTFPVVLTTTANGAFIGTFFSIFFLRKYVANFGTDWILIIVFGSALLVAILKLVLAIAIEPRVSLALSNFIVTLILSNVLFYVTGDSYTVTWQNMLWSMLMAAGLTVFTIFPVIGAIIITFIGISVLFFGINMLRRGFWYDAMLNPALFAYDTLADMVD